MTAEAIAKVVADLRAKRVRQPPQVETSAYDAALRVAAEGGPVVDATGIYNALVQRDDQIAVYDDHPCIAPPWPDASVCYVNEHGNVIVMSVMSADYAEGDRGPRWETAEDIDWNRVRWVTHVFVWCGGRGQDRRVPTFGPMHLWQLAIYDDGEPADMHWVQLAPDYPMERWDMAHLVVLGSLNFLNCRNVELVEPERPRAEWKRIARTGVRVSTINVFPSGKATRGPKGSGGAGTPLTSVRGHMAHYGACCAYHEPRGLFFGKLEGRFWIPQHARGSADQGEMDSDYRLRPQ